jgi:hypothetical protein
MSAKRSAGRSAAFRVATVLSHSRACHRTMVVAVNNG